MTVWRQVRIGSVLTRCPRFACAVVEFPNDPGAGAPAAYDVGGARRSVTSEARHNPAERPADQIQTPPRVRRLALKMLETRAASSGNPHPRSAYRQPIESLSQPKPHTALPPTARSPEKPPSPP